MVFGFVNRVKKNGWKQNDIQTNGVPIETEKSLERINAR